MLSGKMQNALNGHLNEELYSAYLYLSMAAYFQAINLNGFAHWMSIQVQEELVHARKSYYFINERYGRVLPDPVKGAPTEWDSPLAALEDSYRHERNVSGRINDLVNLALGKKDHATHTFLQWFVTEQVEEETSSNEVVQKLKLVGRDPYGLFMLDNELAHRVFTPQAGGESTRFQFDGCR